MLIPIPEGKKNVEVTFPDDAPPPNQVPIVNAGANINITLPANSVQLNGSATDPDGVIAAYVWEKISGSGTIATPNTASTSVTGLAAGTSIFRLSVVDNSGASVSDDVAVIVTQGTPPPTPGYQLVFQSEFDKDNDIRNNDSQQAGKGVISTKQFKTAPASFYAIPDNVSSGTRSEVQYLSPVQNPIEGAIEYWVYYEVIVGSNGCSVQWHPNTPGSSGSPYLMHEGGKFTWVVWDKDGTNDYYQTGVTIKKGVWMLFRIEYKFDRSAGYLRHWIDGVKVLDKSGIQLGDGSGQYLKLGTNFWDPSALSCRTFYDSLKIYKKP